MSTPRVLFVDDEINLLQSLKRLLRPRRKEWNMMFAANGVHALDMLDAAPVDLVVTDIRMPEMDGARLLQRLKAQSPHSIRFILSGQADRSTVRDCVGLSHQFLSKPCDTTALIALIDEVLALRAKLPFSVVESLAQLNALPTEMARLQQLSRNVREGGFSLLKMAHIIDQDLALSAKILQVVNSAYFRRGEAILSPEEAVQMLDVDEMRSLLENAGFINALDEDAPWASAYVEACKSAMASAQNVDEKDVLARQRAKFARLGHAALIATGHEVDEDLGNIATEFLIHLWGLPSAFRTPLTTI